MPLYVIVPVVMLIITLIIYAVCTLILDNTPRTELSTFGSEIDFASPEIVAHTADDGIAVVNQLTVDSGELTVSAPVRITNDPDTIWLNETSHTHGGFTMPVAMDGEAIGVLTIPDIGLSVRVYEGEDNMELMERGVAHFRHTSAWYGNTGLSAHNVNLDGTPGYFLNLHRLSPGAVIRYETAHGMREYAVETIREIDETDWSMLSRTEDNRITLITCITGKPDLRLAVQAVETFS